MTSPTVWVNLDQTDRIQVMVHQTGVIMGSLSPAAEALLTEAGPTVSIPVVAKCFGIHRVTAYDLAQRGELGVPVLRLGRTLRVPTAELRRVLGLSSGGDMGGAA